MAGYLPYPEYKESGVEWLGEVPRHWEVDRAKWSVMGCQNGIWGSEPDGVDDLACIRVADFDRNSFTVNADNLTMRAITQKERFGRNLNRGDLLIEKSGGGDQQLVGAVVEYSLDIPAVTSNFVAKMASADGMHSRFFTYVHAHLYLGRVNYRSIKQTTGIQNLDSQNYLDEPVAYPPLKEQKTIARFLDHKTTQIDALIAKKQTLLEKLAEKRTALISHSVTKGLDSNVKMKDSGVEWLGQVPEHWGVSKLSLIATSLQTGPFGSQLHAGDYIEGGTPLINPADIVNGQLVANLKNTVSEDVVERLSRHVLELGDIVIARRGEMGRAGVVTDENIGWLCGTGSLRARIDQNKIIPEYLLMQFSLHGISDYLSLQSVGSTMDNLNTSILGRLPVLMPSIKEQREILLALDEAERAVTLQAGKVGDAIEKLKEYRSVLITQSVTGKIDVRNVEIPGATTEGQAA